MTTMVERMARAMAEAEGWRWGDERQMLYCTAATSRERDTWRKRARTAIKAMREPTEVMLEAVSKAEDERGYIPAANVTMSAEDAWPIMIAAAISEHEAR